MNSEDIVTSEATERALMHMDLEVIQVTTHRGDQRLQRGEAKVKMVGERFLFNTKYPKDNSVRFIGMYRGPVINGVKGSVPVLV